ncbi:MAG: hypothetical protein CMJ78_25520 [Planctomycetaceae bacterium]|nr:hypothetical protein [Planctomycetaceae bacterium]
MDVFRQFTQQLQQAFTTMTLWQRALWGTVLLTVLLTFGYIAISDGSSSYEPLAWGTQFDAEQLAQAEQTLQDAGLLQYRREQRQLLAPTDQVEVYNAALLEQGGLPQSAASEWERQFDKANPLISTNSERQQLKEIALRNELRRVIRAVPQIEDASIIWARGQRGLKWSSRPKVTATVFVMPKAEAQLSTLLIQSLREVVAGAVADLQTEDVVVFDQRRGRHISSKNESWFDDGLLEYTQRFEEAQEERLRHSLSYIRDIRITAAVDVDRLLQILDEAIDEVDPLENKEALVPRQQTDNQWTFIQPVANRPTHNQAIQTAHQVTETENPTKAIQQRIDFEMMREQLAAALPKALRVSVSIPDDHYRAIALKYENTSGQGAVTANEIEQLEIKRVRETVTTLLPSGTSGEGVSVTTYSRVQSDVASRANAQSTDAIHEWAGLAGLILLSLVLAFYWRQSAKPRTMVSTTPQQVETPSLGLNSATVPTRESVEEIVKQHPDDAARLIAQWLQSAKE